MGAYLVYWIPFQIADYESDTKNLSPLEHGIYLLLLMHNWKGKPLPKENDQLYRITSAFSQSERDAIAYIIANFFEEKSDGFWNKKAKEIHKNQKARSDKAQASAMKRWHANASNSHIPRQCKPELELELDINIDKVAVASNPPTPQTDQATATLDLKIKDTRSNRTLSEADWLREQLIHEVKRSGYRRINELDMTLTGFMYSNPVAQKLGGRWLATPIDCRMAALSYAAGKPNVTNELSYALKAIEDNWDGYAKLIPAAKKAIEANDYEVEI